MRKQPDYKASLNFWDRRGRFALEKIIRELHNLLLEFLQHLPVGFGAAATLPGRRTARYQTGIRQADMIPHEIGG
ncbi:MAG: hypothetical protein MUP19_12265 [Candidatus Aminicenantes bacterium]|nr:hypothetical protein [Candidatus Aminicenantes bacterium]